MRVSYRAVSLAASLLAAASITALIVVASLEDASALASTAIALAIITFIVQLIVYVAQAEQTRRENELTQSLHAELRSSLADLTARAQGTEATVASINDKVLDKALQLTGSSKLENLPPGFTRDLAQNVAELLAQPIARPNTQDPGRGDFQTEFPPKSWGPEEDLRVLGLLTSWPSDSNEVHELRKLVEGLTDTEALALSAFARDEESFRNPGNSIAPSLATVHEYAQGLYDRGLVADVGDTAYGKELAALTEAGRKAARVFTAPGNPPEEIAELVRDLRNKAASVLGNRPDEAAAIRMRLGVPFGI
jgi:hypothetical protein